MIYLDNAATTPMDRRVKEAMEPYFSQLFGNPGSFNSAGLPTKNATEHARKKIARILNCTDTEIIFTSGGTESNNLALQGVYRALKTKGKHIITSKVEHPAILETCEYLEREEGAEITYLDVDAYGMVHPEEVKKAIKENTILVSIMYANNEIGTINPIQEIAKVCKEKRILFHTDACQAAGYCSIDTKELGIDLMTINGSKIYGPKGTGLLYIKRGTSIKPLLFGGQQENRMRAGTENVPGIIGLTKALEIAHEEKEQETIRLTYLRDKLINGVMQTVPKTFLNGHPTERLPNNANLSFLDIEGEALLLYLDGYGIAASSGSACTSHTLDPSHVILATGLPYEAAHGSIRFTLGKQTTEKDIDAVLEKLPALVKALREISPVNVAMEEVLEIRRKKQ